jgi:hypothetical protein
LSQLDLLPRIILPGKPAPERRHYAQMSVPICFWYSAKLSHIMTPPHWSVPAPVGYERIECRHARDVEIWSKRQNEQEKRIAEMSLEERYNFEEPIRQHMMSELRANLQSATDPTNRIFLERAIEQIQKKREHVYKEVVESRMACEAKEGVAS